MGGNLRENPYIRRMETKSWAAVQAPADLPAEDFIDSGPKSTSVIVPIRSLGARHRQQIIAHLLDLDERDRYLRFGFIASDEHVVRYAEGLDFDRDEIFGITNRKLALIAMAHLAYGPPEHRARCAEFGVSVAKAVRGRGYGARLFERAAMDARNNGVALMFIHALSENSAMLGIAHKAGATLERHGSETEAFLRLAPPSLNSRITEILEEHLAQLDYRFKAQGRHWQQVLAAINTLSSNWPVGCNSRRN